MALKVFQFKSDLSVIIDFQFVVSKVVKELETSKLLAGFIVWVNCGHNCARISVNYMALREVFSYICAEKGVIGDRERESLQLAQLHLEMFVVRVLNWALFTFSEGFFPVTLNIFFELLHLFSLKFLE